MINTIFYFADTLPFSSYTEQVNSGDISTQTIVFVRDTKSIYMGGQQYGSMTPSDFRDLLSTVVRSGNSEVNTQIDNINTAIEQLQQNIQNNITQLNSSIQDVSTLASGQKTRLDGIVNNLDQQVSALVDQNIEDLNLGTAYAKKNDVGAILEWLYSGLKASSAEDKSYNQLVTAAKNDTLGTSAISELFTEIDALDNKYVAKTGFASSVDSAIAALLLEASNESSLMSIVNRVGANENNISAISSKMTGDNAYTEMLNALEDELNGTTVKSNVKSVVDSNAQTAAAKLFSTVSNDKDEITASSIASAITSNSSALAELGTHFVDANGVNTIVENKLTAAAGVANWTEYAALITEDHTAIGSLSSTVENLPDSSSIVTTTMISSITDENTGEITAASIIAKVNEGTSSVSISADRLDLSGTTWAINNDGSGFLANHKIDWGTNGGLNINSDSLVVDTVHPWWGNYQMKGNGAICILGDYTNTPVSVEYDSENQTYTKIYVRDSEGYENDKQFTADLATACPAAIFDGSGAGIALMNPAGHGANVQIQAGVGNEIITGVNYLNTFVQLQAVAWGTKLPSAAEYLGTPNGSSDGLAISNDVLVDGEIIASHGIFASGSNDNILGSTKFYGTAKIKSNISASYKKTSAAGGDEVDLNGISKTIKIGNYYLTFAKGILIRCETTDPFTGNDPFIDTTEYAANTWDTTVIDTAQASA